MLIKAQYPTLQHDQAAKKIVKHFEFNPDIEAVILSGPCAHGHAVADSCLDISVLVLPETLLNKKDELVKKWEEFHKKEKIFRVLGEHCKYSGVNLDFINGTFELKPRDWMSGPDSFELEIGNTLYYSAPILEQSEYLKILKTKWLPYYDEKLRQERLAMIRNYCYKNLEHVVIYNERRLYFQAFDRFYDGLREFLQALFISRRVYPIAYDNWIRAQIEGMLKLPELFEKLKVFFLFKKFTSSELNEKSKELKLLFDQYIAIT
jgi:hypothetical protein